MFSILYVENLSQRKIQANAFRLMLPKAMRETRKKGWNGIEIRRTVSALCELY